MATIESYSDLEQSKTLSKILPLESADMVLLHEEPYETSDSKFDGLHQALCVPFNKYDKSWRQKYKNISYFPCWSLAALLDVLPKNLNIGRPSLNSNYKGYYWVQYYDEYMKPNNYKTVTFNNPVDACVAMIENLHELNLL